MASRPVLVVGTRSRTTLIFLRHRPHILRTLQAGAIADYRGVLSSFLSSSATSGPAMSELSGIVRCFFLAFHVHLQVEPIHGTFQTLSDPSVAVQVLIEQAGDAQSLLAAQILNAA